MSAGRAALLYAERFGFAVFPCRPRGKEPLTAHGCKDASKDGRAIQQWWERWPEANVAIATGAVSRIVVIDEDPRHSGHQTLAGLEVRHGKLPQTPRVLTGGGGRHLYFRAPSGVIVHNSAGAIGPGIDVRGDGGYVIAPPSIHASRNEYRWEVSAHINELPLPELPPWLLKLITVPATGGETGRFETPEAIEDGARNDTLFRLARSLHTRKLNYEEILATLRAVNPARCDPPLSDTEVEQIARNAATEPDRPDFQTPSPEMQTVAALLTLDPIARAKEKKALAKSFRVSQKAIDEALASCQSDSARMPAAKEPPQWSPAAKVWDTPIAGPALLTELIAAIRRFVLLDHTAALIVALWILFTWVFEHIAETNPYLRIISPTPECGKSTLLKIVKRLTRSGWLVSRITASSFSRTLDRERRTLLLDEGDAFLHENEVMRNLLDGASDPDTANISLSEKTGDNWTPIELNVFVPIAIASIGTLRKMQTVESRSIPIQLKRATPAELKSLAKGRRRELKAVLDPLAAKCARWATDNVEALKNARPELPDSLLGRDMDKWEPLIAIADAIADEAGRTAREAAIAVLGARDPDAAPLSVALLADARWLFDEKKTDKFPSKALCEALAEIEGRSWAEYGKARKPISQNQLARQFKPFGIFPHTIRLADGSTPKGYERKDFKDAFDRYLTIKEDDPNRHNATSAGAEGASASFQSATQGACGASDNGSFPHGEKDCGTVADGNQENKDEGLEL